VVYLGVQLECGWECVDSIVKSICQVGWKCTIESNGKGTVKQAGIVQTSSSGSLLSSLLKAV